MKKLFIPLFLVVVLSLIVIGCKKDKDDDGPNNNNSQDVRTSEYTFIVSGDFEGEFDLNVNNAMGVTGGVVGLYESDINEFSLSMTATGLPENATWGLELYASMPQLVPGSYVISEPGLESSQFFYTVDSSNDTFTVTTGTLNITNVDPAPLFLPGAVSGHYINGNFSLEMSNPENETATAEGQIVNGFILSY